MEPETKRVSLTKPSQHRSPEQIPDSHAPSAGTVIPREIPHAVSPQPIPDTGTKFCQTCGQALAAAAAICPFCGTQVGYIRTTAHIAVDITRDPAPEQHVIYSTNGKNKWVALILCLFFGYLGAHKFYEGKIGLGVLYFFTFGLFSIGTIVDLIVLLTRPTVYYP